MANETNENDSGEKLADTLLNMAPDQYARLRAGVLAVDKALQEKEQFDNLHTMTNAELRAFTLKKFGFLPNV